MSDWCISEYKENCCLQWLSYFTAACSFIDYPKHRPFHIWCRKDKFVDAFLQYNSSASVCAGVSSLLTHEVCLAVDRMIHRSWCRYSRNTFMMRTGAELELVERPWSLMAAKCLFNYHITFFMSLHHKVSVQYVAIIHLNEHETTWWLFESELKDSRTNVIILRSDACAHTRLSVLGWPWISRWVMPHQDATCSKS